MSSATTMKFDIETLIKLTGDPQLVQELQDATEAAGRRMDEDFLRPLIRHAVVDAVVKCTYANRKEASDFLAEVRFNAEHLLDMGKGIPEIAPEVKTRTVGAFEMWREPYEEDYHYSGPFPEGVSASVVGRREYSRLPEMTSFKTIFVHFEGEDARYVFTVKLEGPSSSLSLLEVAIGVLDKEPNEYGFYGRIEHYVTAKARRACWEDSVCYKWARSFLSNALEAFSQKMNNESFKDILGAMDDVFAEKKEGGRTYYVPSPMHCPTYGDSSPSYPPLPSPSPSPLPSPPPRRKRARSELQSPSPSPSE